MKLFDIILSKIYRIQKVKQRKKEEKNKFF